MPGLKDPDRKWLLPWWWSEELLARILGIFALTDGSRPKAKLLTR
jgi:hypothetical protein